MIIFLQDIFCILKLGINRENPEIICKIVKYENSERGGQGGGIIFLNPRQLQRLMPESIAYEDLRVVGKESLKQPKWQPND